MIKTRTWRGDELPYAHYKLDGISATITKEVLDVRVETRKPTNVTHQVFRNEWCERVLRRVPCGTTILGELWCPGRPASHVRSALAEGESIELGVFAVESMPAFVGLEAVQRVVEAWGLQFVEYITDVDPAALVGAWGAFSAWNPDVEGFVFKRGNLQDWQKWKPVRTIDCVVVGTTDGEGKYLGLLGSLRVAVYRGEELVEVARVSGMDDATRVDATLHDPEGRVVEVAYQYVGSRGRLRHPRFVRWRDDKNPRECEEDQL